MPDQTLKIIVSAEDRASAQVTQLVAKIQAEQNAMGKREAADRARLDQMIFDSTHTARERDLASADAYFNRLRAKWDGNAEMQVKINEAANRRIGEIRRAIEEDRGALEAAALEREQSVIRQREEIRGATEARAVDWARKQQEEIGAIEAAAIEKQQRETERLSQAWERLKYRLTGFGAVLIGMRVGMATIAGAFNEISLHRDLYGADSAARAYETILRLREAQRDIMRQVPLIGTSIAKAMEGFSDDTAIKRAIENVQKLGREIDALAARASGAWRSAQDRAELAAALDPADEARIRAQQAQRSRSTELEQARRSAADAQQAMSDAEQKRIAAEQKEKGLWMMPGTAGALWPTGRRIQDEAEAARIAEQESIVKWQAASRAVRNLEKTDAADRKREAAEVAGAKTKVTDETAQASLAIERATSRYMADELTRRILSEQDAARGIIETRRKAGLETETIERQLALNIAAIRRAAREQERREAETRAAAQINAMLAEAERVRGIKNRIRSIDLSNQVTELRAQGRDREARALEISEKYRQQREDTPGIDLKRSRAAEAAEMAALTKSARGPSFWAGTETSTNPYLTRTPGLEQDPQVQEQKKSNALLTENNKLLQQIASTKGAVLGPANLGMN